MRYDPAYPATIEAVCALEAVDLIIPATDELRARGIPFVETTLPSRYHGAWGSVVVKPREGWGSRAVHVDPEDWHRFADTFIVQKRLVGRRSPRRCGSTAGGSWSVTSP